MFKIKDSELAQSIYIKPEEVSLFTIAWETIMIDFKIPQEQQVEIFDIMLNFFETLDRDSLYIYELNCAMDAIDFLIEYINRFDKYKVGKTSYEIDKYAKVRFQIGSGEIELKYPNVSQFTASALYKHFRKYDNFLRHYLNEFETLPSVDDLQNIKTLLGSKRDDGMQYYVIEQIENLKKYVNEHLSNELSEKVNRFIFELLYLFNILQYAGKVVGKNSQDFALSDQAGNAKFNSSSIEDTDKTAFITTIIVNAGKKKEYDLKTKPQVEN